MKILMVLTSHDRLGMTGRKTGFWLEEFAAPYFVFRDAGVELTLASPKGGQPPVDPKSDLPENQTPAMARFKMDQSAQQALAHTVRLEDVNAKRVLSCNCFVHRQPGRSLRQLLTNHGQQQPQIRIGDARLVDKQLRLQIDDRCHNGLVFRARG